MPRVAAPQTTELNGFDDHGVFVGSARLSFGSWSVVCRRNPVASNATREEAERLLKMYGATHVRESSGVKQ